MIFSKNGAGLHKKACSATNTNEKITLKVNACCQRLVPEATLLTRFAFNYVETLLRSLQNPSKLGSYSLACAFATRVGTNFACAARDHWLQNSPII